MNIVPVVNHKEGVGGKNHQDIIPRDSQKLKREIGALAWTGIIEEKEVWKDIEITETTIMEEETKGVDMRAEIIALIGMIEGNTHQTGMEEGSIAQDRETGRKDMVKEQEIGKSIHQMKAEGTLATGEGDAKGP